MHVLVPCVLLIVPPESTGQWCWKLWATLLLSLPASHLCQPPRRVSTMWWSTQGHHVQVRLGCKAGLRCFSWTRSALTRGWPSPSMSCYMLLALSTSTFGNTDVSMLLLFLTVNLALRHCMNSCSESWKSFTLLAVPKNGCFCFCHRSFCHCFCPHWRFFGLEIAFANIIWNIIATIGILSQNNVYDNQKTAQYVEMQVEAKGSIGKYREMRFLFR